MTESDAVALSQEAYTYPVKFHNHHAIVTATYCWKQTWRNTPQGWKLACMEPYREDFDKVQGVTFTMLRDAKSDPAKTQAKQNVVK